MNNKKSSVKLIGHRSMTPEEKNLDSGKKIVRLYCNQRVLQRRGWQMDQTYRMAHARAIWWFLYKVVLRQ